MLGHVRGRDSCDGRARLSIAALVFFSKSSDRQSGACLALRTGVILKRSRGARSPQSGSALVEALIAIAVLITVATSMAQLILRSRRVVWMAGRQSAAVSIAQQKLEQLTALEWRVDGAGLRHSDLTSGLSFDPATDGGTGLLRSPPDALERNLDGFADFVGADGRWVGRGAGPIAGAIFVRRWSVVPYDADAADTLVLTVVAFPVSDAAAGSLGPASARLQTILTRTIR
jgi:hypothetical protein